MPIRISSKDIDIFMAVAEYRVLTVEQISLLLDRNQKSIYRRLNGLVKHNLIA
jgi:predicted transcriptional regulator